MQLYNNYKKDQADGGTIGHFSCLVCAHGPVVNMHNYAHSSCFVMQLVHVFFQSAHEKPCWFSDKNNQSIERDTQADRQRQEEETIAGFH